MKTVTLLIMTDPVMIDALSDYLIGVCQAAVDCGVNSAGEVTTLRAIVAVADEASVALMVENLEMFSAEMAQVFRVNPPAITAQELTDQDWSKHWRSLFKPLHLLDNLVIVPSWEQYQPAVGEMIIRMDPGMAFGTGQHETTQMCTVLIRTVCQCDLPTQMLDVGTGTGVLAMAAACLGIASVVAIDHDPDAVSAARDNVANNNLADKVQVSSAELTVISAQFDLVVANIVHDVLVVLADHLAARTRQGGTLVLSGLIEGSQVQSITRVFAARGFRVIDKITRGVWASLHLQKQ